MTIAFISANTAVGVSGGGFSLNDPGVAGAFLIAMITLDDGTGGIAGPDSSWIVLYDDLLTYDGQEVCLLYKASATGSGSYAFTGPTTGAWSAVLRGYSGVNSVPIHAYNHNVNNSGNPSPISMSTTSLTTTVSGCMLVYLSAPDATGTSGGPTYTDPSGYSNVADQASGAQAASICMSSDFLQTSAGATGTVTGTITQTGGTGGWVAYMVALAPQGTISGISVPTNFVFYTAN